MFSVGHERNIESAFNNSRELNLQPNDLNFKKLNEHDYEMVLAVIDKFQSEYGQIFEHGRCIQTHLYLKSALAQYGYISELVIGSVKVNGQPYYSCDIEYIKDQLIYGRQKNTDLNIHCWLLLENYYYLDITLHKDVYPDEDPAILLGVDKIYQERSCFEYSPILIGDEFIYRTCLIDKQLLP